MSPTTNSSLIWIHQPRAFGCHPFWQGNDRQPQLVTDIKKFCFHSIALLHLEKPYSFTTGKLAIWCLHGGVLWIIVVWIELSSGDPPLISGGHHSRGTKPMNYLDGLFCSELWYAILIINSMLIKSNLGSGRLSDGFHFPSFISKETHLSVLV